MRSTWKKAFLGAVIGIFVVYFIVLLAANKSVSQFAPLPNPNGFDDFLKAGSLLSAFSPVSCTQMTLSPFTSLWPVPQSVTSDSTWSEQDLLGTDSGSNDEFSEPDK
jgi:hypothetical protein